MRRASVRSGVVGFALAAACWRSPAPAPAPAYRSAAPDTAHSASQQAAPADPPAPAPIASEPAAPRDAGPHVLVAGCNQGCTQCSLADRQSYIVGTLDRTGARLFPAATPTVGGGAFSCSAQVALGERVTLHAHSTSGLVIEAWKPFGTGDACPCEGTSGTTCSFVVTPELAARHSRIYCGAYWRAQAPAQLGR
jgi:hypothetical protein